MNRIHRTTRHQRRGYLYVGVMITSTIVAIVGLAAMSVARTQLRNATGGMDDELARILAQSGVELGIAQINNDPSWQTNISHGVELPAGGVSANGGTMHWQLDNGPGGNGKVLTGIGRKDDAEVRLQVTVGAGGTNSLGFPLLVGGNVTILASTETLSINAGSMACNSTVTNNGTLSGDLQAQSFSNGGTHTGTSTVPGAIQSLPDPLTVFDYYKTQGTLLPNGSLDDGSGGLAIAGELLSPSANPWGTPNPDGIYVINAQGKSVRVEQSRIIGTLVIYNMGLQQASLKDSNNLECAYPNYPVLMVDGNLDVRLSDLPLTESDASTNLNPTGTPYQGNTDTDISDNLASAAAGIVYVSGNILFDGQNNKQHAPRFTGVVICDGNVTCQSKVNVSIDYDATFAATPAPGFGAASSGQIAPGSWKRIASP